jgi:hypothetical protein
MFPERSIPGPILKHTYPGWEIISHDNLMTNSKYDVLVTDTPTQFV